MNISELKHPNIVMITREELNLLKDEQILLKLDLLTLAEKADLLVDAYPAIIHLCQTVLGIMDSSNGRMDAHRRQTIKGVRRKLKEQMDEIADLCDETGENLEEISLRWDFLDVSDVLEDDV